MSGIASASADAIFVSAPGLVPFTGIGIAFIGSGFAVVATYAILILLFEDIRSAVASDSSPNTSKGQTRDWVDLLLVYLPGLSILLGALSLIPESFLNVLDALGNLLKNNLPQLLARIAIAILLALALTNQSSIVESVGEFYTCQAYPHVIAVGLSFLNLLVTFIADVLPVINMITSILITPFRIFLRTMYDCVQAGGFQATWGVVQDFLLSLVDGLVGILAAIDTFLTSGDLQHNRIEFTAALTQLFGAFTAIAPIFDCACSMLGPLWAEFFALPQSPSFVAFWDCSLNIPVRIVQSISLAITTPEIPQINATIQEEQCAVIAAGEFAEVLGLFAFNFVVDFFASVVNLTSVDPGLQILLNRPDHMPTFSAASYGYQASAQQVTAANLLVGSAAFPHLPNITNITVFVDYFRSIFASDWAGGITFSVAGVLALVNGTWSLTALLVPLEPVVFSDIQYFQLGFIVDWFRRAGLAVGTVIAAITVEPQFEFFVGGLIALVFGAIQIVLELLVDLTFYNFYYPPASGAFFQPASVYCNANNTTPELQLEYIYNSSASLGIILGCNQSLDPFPLSSPDATCAQVANPMGCIGMNLFRLLAEIVTYLEHVICNLPMTLLFLPPLQFSPPPPQIEANPSNPILTNFANMSLDGVARQWIHFGVCLQNLLYFFDLDAGFGGFPLNATCQFVDPSSPTGTGYRISLFCTLGNILNTVWLLIGGTIYTILLGVNTALGAIAFPALTSGIQLPTFSAEIRDLQLLACLLGGWIASFTGITFSCSAQGATGFGYPVPRTIPSPAQLTDYPAITNLSQRFPYVTYCSHDRFAWAADPPSPCNCSNITTYFDPVAINAPACFLDCLQPGIIFPRRAGFNAGIPLPCNGTSIFTTWTNSTTFRDFLGGIFPHVVNNFLPSGLIDPTASTTPEYGPAAFMQELMTAQLNDELNRMYNPSWTPRWNQLSCPTLPLVNATVDTAWGAVVIEIGLVFFSRLITLTNYWIYSGLPLTTDAITNQPYCFVAQNTSSGTTRFDYTLAVALASFTATYGWNTTAIYLHRMFQIFNEDFTDCNLADTTCLVLAETAATPAPIYGAIASLPNPGNGSSICTFNETGWLANTTLCDCSQTPSQLYSMTNGGGHCLLICDSPAFPMLLGSRFDFCMVPANCENHAFQVTDYAALHGVLINTDPPTGPFVTTFPPTPVGPPVYPGKFAAKLMAATLNLQYIARYRIGQYIYVRQRTDPLFTETCLHNVQARTVFGGQQMNVVVDVLNILWAGSGNYPRQCNYYFHAGTAAFALCNSLLINFSPYTTNGPNAAPSYQGNTTTDILPLLDAFNEYSLNCGANASTCFFTSIFNSINNSEPLLPPDPVHAHNFTNPQFYATIRQIPIDQLQPCVELVQCSEGMLCSIISIFTSFLTAISEVLHQIKLTIAGTRSVWKLGQTIWEIATEVLTDAWLTAMVAVAKVATYLDCVMCALDGNTTSVVFCQNLLFSALRPVAALFAFVGRTIIVMATATVQFVVEFLQGILGGNILLALSALGTWLYNVVVNIIVPIIEGLFGFAFGLACACNFLATFASSFPCHNSGYCTKKRWLQDIAGSLNTEAVYELPAQIRYMYEWFAPGDWTSRYIWIAGSYCAQRMAELGALRLARSLVESESDEAAYCLSYQVLFSDLVSNPNASHYLPMLQLDECRYVMKSLAPVYASATPFPSLSLADRTAALRCIQEAGVVHAATHTPQAGYLGWIPIQTLSMARNPMNWLTLGRIVFDGLRVSANQGNDLFYSDAVLKSDDYRAGLNAVYGAPRVALAAEAVTTGTIPTADRYVDAMIAAAPSTATSDEVIMVQMHRRRVISFVGFANLVRDEAAGTMVPQIFSNLRYTLPAAFPATLPSFTPSARAITDELNDVNETAGPGPSDDQRLVTRLSQITGTWVNAMGVVYDGLLNVGPADTPAAVGPTFAQRKRHVASTPMRSGARSQRTTLQKPGILRLVATGMAGVFQSFKEWANGEAERNATGIASAKTKFRWHHRSRPRPTTDTYGNRLYGLAGPLIPRMIQRYRQVFAGLAQIQAHDAVSARNNNAASDFRQGLLNTFQAVQTGQKISTMSQIRASDANTTFPVPVDECFNVTSISFCQQCFAINLFLGFNARTGQAGLYYYNISIPPPQPACTFATANANFEFFSLYLFNMTSASPLTIGNSDSLPARFPARGHSPWAYLDDHVPSKNYFSAYDSLFNATWTFILNAIHSIDVFSSDPFNLASVNATNVTVVGAAARKEHVRTEAWKKGVPKPLPLGELPFTDRFLESMAAWMPAVHITATNFTTFQQIIEGYINLVITEFVICQYGSDLDGTNTHMSLLQALVILIIIIAILALIWSVLSSVFQAVWTFLLSFLVDAGQAIFMGTALRIVSQGLLSLFVLFFFISLATGWRLLCFPLVPPILFSSQVMSLATTVFPKCPVLYAGLINEQDYANGVCMLCNLWQEGHWSVASCKSDLNWNPLDVPVAFLRWYFPDALAFIQTPANFAFPFSALIAASGVQAYLHKYDSVDIQGDDIIYSQQLSCLFLVELIPFLVYSELLGFLILSSPTFAILRFLLAIASVAISALFAFIISFFVGMYFTLLLPLRVVRYQRLDSQRRTKL